MINSVFHSGSGGKTENSGSVWKNQFPYLVSVQDYDQSSPYFKWSKHLKHNELNKIFSDIGGLNSIEIMKRSTTNRVVTARVYGPLGSIDINGKELRRRLNLKSTLFDLQFKPNNLDTLNKISTSLFLSDPLNSQNPEQERNNASIDYGLKQGPKNFQPPPKINRPSPPPRLPTSLNFLEPPSRPSLRNGFSLVVKGFGSGHGVGLSQWGAYGLAQKGYDYRRILKHFYKGVYIVPFSKT